MTATDDANALDDARVAAYRAAQRRRLAVGQAMQARLAGNPAARAALEARWAPLRDWLRERKETEQ